MSYIELQAGFVEGSSSCVQPGGCRDVLKVNTNVENYSVYFIELIKIGED